MVRIAEGFTSSNKGFELGGDFAQPSFLDGWIPHMDS
jgi:hypothetical protein